MTLPLTGAGKVSGSLTPSWVLKSGAAAATLDIDFANNRAWLSGALSSVSALLACSRASNGYYLNADGTLTQFSSNQLRTGTNGALFEGAGTNYFPQSGTLDDATIWAGTLHNIAVTQSGTFSGINTYNLVPDGTNTFHRARNATSTSVTTAITYSLIAKANGYSQIGIRETKSGSGCVFNVSNGTNATPSNSGTWVPSNPTITALANGFYCVAITFTAAVADNNQIDILVYPATYTSGDLEGSTAVGNTVSGVLVTAVQGEASAFATSYIPTAATNAARAADVVTFSDTTWFDGTSDTIFAKWTASGRAGTLWAIDAANDTTLSETATGAAKILDAGATFAITTGNTDTAGATAKAAAHMATNDIALCLNGGTVGTDTSATQPGTISAARLGIDLSGANALNGYILEVAAFKSLLVNSAGLQTLTT